MKLYTTPKSANGIKALAAVHILSLPVHIEIIDVYAGAGWSPAYRAINPQGKVPTLVDGALTLWESNAILQYLAELTGQLTASTPAGRADIARWLFWETAHWQPALVTVLAPVAGWKLGLTPEPTGPLDWAPAETALSLLETHFQGQRFLVGDSLTIADLSLSAMLIYAHQLPEGFPGVSGWRARVAAMPGWQAALSGLWDFERNG